MTVWSTWAVSSLTLSLVLAGAGADFIDAGMLAGHSESGGELMEGMAEITSLLWHGFGNGHEEEVCRGVAEYR